MMAKKYLRQISNIVQATGQSLGGGGGAGTPVNIGSVVPAGKRRIIYRMIIGSWLGGLGVLPSTSTTTVQLWSNGATGTVPLDRFNVTADSTYQSVRCIGKDIANAVYILTSGQRLGMTVQVGVNIIVSVTILYYDEV